MATPLQGHSERAATVQERSMKKETLQPKVWTKPEIRKLGELKDVRAGTNPSAANGSMS